MFSIGHSLVAFLAPSDNHSAPSLGKHDLITPIRQKTTSASKRVQAAG